MNTAYFSRLVPKLFRKRKENKKKTNVTYPHCVPQSFKKCTFKDDGLRTGSVTSRSRSPVKTRQVKKKTRKKNKASCLEFYVAQEATAHPKVSFKEISGKKGLKM